MNINDLYLSGSVMSQEGKILNRDQMIAELKAGRPVKIYGDNGEVNIVYPPVPVWMKTLLVVGIPCILYFINDALRIAGY